MPERRSAATERETRRWEMHRHAPALGASCPCNRCQGRFEDDLIYAIKGLAKHELGEAFGEDAGLCWCDPFYRGTEWPGHDVQCSWIRGLLA